MLDGLLCLKEVELGVHDNASFSCQPFQYCQSAKWNIGFCVAAFVDHGGAAATKLVGQFDHDAGHFAITVAAMIFGAAAHHDIFVRFVKRNGLDDELIRRDWDSFARQCKGPKYKENKYDMKLAAAYAVYRAGGAYVDSPNPVVQMGDTDEAVKKLQRLLKIGDDGDFGPGTKAAVVKFRKGKGLFADWIVGKGTSAALGRVGRPIAACRFVQH